MKKYKSRRPDRIQDLLDKEPDSVEDDKTPQHARIFDDLHDAIGDQSFKTMEEAQAFVDSWMNKRNAGPLPQFLGLSPDQMHRLLDRPLDQIPDIVTFATSVSIHEITKAPIVQEAFYFLRRLAEGEPLEATAKGNLPRAFAQEFHARFPEIPALKYSIRSEEDDWKLVALRHIMRMAGWMRKRDRKFCLTERGKKVAEGGFGRDEYRHLLEIYLQQFNWASRDLLPKHWGHSPARGPLFSLPFAPKSEGIYRCWRNFRLLSSLRFLPHSGRLRS